MSLSPEIQTAINSPGANEEGFHLRDLLPGVEIHAETRNTLYVIQVREDGLYASGGRHLPEMQPIRLAGSTFGGSMIKPDWIGNDMHMEIFIPGIQKTITTTAVRRWSIVMPQLGQGVQPSQSRAAA